MSITVRNEGAWWVIRLAGTPRKAEMELAQGELDRDLCGAKQAKILVIADNLTGWNMDHAVNVVGQLKNYASHIDRLAIVCGKQCENQPLMLADSGILGLKTRFLFPGQIAEAILWLAGEDEAC